MTLFLVHLPMERFVVHAVVVVLLRLNACTAQDLKRFLALPVKEHRVSSTILKVISV